MRLIPELQVGDIRSETKTPYPDPDANPIANAIDVAERDLLKRWLRVEGPERILAWAADKDPSIEAEGLYARRCQACIRLYQDDQVRGVIERHSIEKMPDVHFAEYLLYEYEQADTDDRDSTSSTELVAK